MEELNLKGAATLSDCKFSAFLSNYDVLTLLKDVDAKNKSMTRKEKNKSNQQLTTVIYEALRYFRSSPCSSQTPEVIYEFVKRMEPFKLTKTEKLNLLNNRPSAPVEIQTIVEESEERLTEEQFDELLAIVEEVLPPSPDLEAGSVDKEVLQTPANVSSSEDNVFKSEGENSS